MQYKAIIMDMDGTLLTSNKKISAETMKMLIRAEKKGVKTIFASGRPYKFMTNYCDYLEQDRPVIADNGAYVKMIYSNQILYKSYLSIEEVLDCIQIAKTYHCTPAFYTEDSVLSFPNNSTLLHYRIINEKLDGKCKLKLIENITESDWKTSYDISGGFHKGVINIKEKTEIFAHLKEALQRKTQLCVTSSRKTNIEINHKNVSKAHAIDIITAYYGISPEEILCIGDGENDIDMLLYAGVGVAMANASDQVKRYADFVTDSNDCNGVAKAIRKFIFNE